MVTSGLFEVKDQLRGKDPGGFQRYQVFLGLKRLHDVLTRRERGHGLDTQKRSLSLRGVPDLLGTFLGAVIMGILSNIMNLCGVSSYWQTVLTGLILVVAILVRKD